MSMSICRIEDRATASVDKQSVALTARGITKSFGATQALRSVNFTLHRGEIHALLGGNGAGKSTLIKILNGELRADAGTLSNDGSGVPGQVAIVHQELAIMRDLSVVENLFAGSARGYRLFPWRSGSDRAERILRTLGLDAYAVQATTRAGSLPLHQLQLVEIGRALAHNAQIILLDEPTAALTSRETDTLFTVLRRLRDEGSSFVFVSHRMEEIRRIVDRITIIRDGITAVDGVSVNDIGDDEVLTQMFGQSIHDEAIQHESNLISSSKSRADTVVVTLTHPNLSSPLSVRGGEVIGLAGAPDGPQHLLETLLGDRLASQWQVDLGDKRGGPPRSTRNAIKRGVGYVSGDRSDKGVISDLSIYDNTAMARQVVDGNWLNLPAAHRGVDRQAHQLGFDHQDLHAQPASLSGGTQQKMLLARWLDLPVRLLLMEEPTRGVDLHTKRDFYRIVQQMTTAGCAVIWWSTEYVELKQVCDKVLAFSVIGEPVSVLAMAETSEQDLLQATGTA